MVAEPKHLTNHRRQARKITAQHKAKDTLLKNAPDELMTDDLTFDDSALDNWGEAHRFRFDVATYQRLGEVGIFAPDTRTELIEGEIIIMSPTGKRHAAKVKKTLIALRRINEKDAIISVQDPFALPGSRSEPVPDVMLLKPRADVYENSLPQPEDVLLLIEVSDSTLKFDRQKKLPLYACHNVRETWLVNLIDNVIEIYTEPRNGKYSVCRIAQSGEKIIVQAFPKLRIKVDDILN